MSLFHLFKVHVLDLLVVAAVVGAALRALRTGLLVEAAVKVGTGLLSTALCSVHLLRSFVPSALQLGRCAVDGGEVLVVVSGLQFRSCSLDLGLVVSGDLVAELLELFLGVVPEALS